MWAGFLKEFLGRESFMALWYGQGSWSSSVQLRGEVVLDPCFLIPCDAKSEEGQNPPICHTQVLRG